MICFADTLNVYDMNSCGSRRITGSSSQPVHLLF